MGRPKKNDDSMSDPKRVLVEEINDSAGLAMNRWEKDRFVLGLALNDNNEWHILDRTLIQHLQEKVLQKDKSFRHFAEKILRSITEHTLLELLIHDSVTHPSFKALQERLIMSIQFGLLYQASEHDKTELNKGDIAHIVKHAFKDAQDEGYVPNDTTAKWYEEFFKICEGYAWSERTLAWTEELNEVTVKGEERSNAPIEQKFKETFLHEVPLEDKLEALELNTTQLKTCRKFYARSHLPELIKKYHEKNRMETR